ncbi:restriction endonuclease subunit S [Aeromonas sp. FDAARGOS 1419]|uniref:restriction endonuclease subunit S n=1 Tax=Aeromonas sp. FDAARGOS 1419 TaxID=2778068 RepID=UPI001C24EC92|nr:restriction endonuclease subunit S [Aeromonas sp. FDAARGOS 1419]QWZ77716.1 restriction endonuclease subunit S [Aeromonas sp. FDAARGOS 1419]
MSSEWPLVVVEDVCELIVDCVNKTAPVVEEPTPYRMIRTTNVRNGRIDLSTCRYVVQETYEKWTRRAKLQPGDVILTREAPIGEVGFVNESEGVFLGQRLMQYRADSKHLDPRFLLYSFLSPALQHQFRSHEGSGSVVSHIRVGDCFKFKMRLPPLAIQQEIAALLGALDERIALLRESNATLEAIAQALFKSWFVDFDPVRARARGEKPAGLAPEVAARFPDSFEESEVGMVPKGWRVLSFTETIDVIGGGTPKTSISEYWNGDIPWFSVVDAPATTDVFVIETEKHITCEGLNKSSTKLLPVGTTIISARGTVGRLALVGQAMAMNQSCYGLSGKAGDVYFTYFSTHRLVETLKQRTHGSVFDTITRDTLAGVSVVYPQTIAITAFEETIAPVMERIKENLIQARTLATLRDTLLPRLISGQLRLPDAEQQLKDLAV